MSTGGSLNQQWARVCTRLRDEVGETAYKSWLKPLTVATLEDGEVRIQVPTRFMRDWVSTHYADRIRALWTGENPRVQSVELVVAAPRVEPGASANDSMPAAAADTDEAAEPPSGLLATLDGRDDVSAPLDPRFSFENFVVGKPNELAYAAARRVADAKQVTFNPLFLYGGVGLGKTHLLHAIGNYVLDRDPEINVLYVSSEKFTNDLINAIRRQQTEEFRIRYRNIDILLIDDIQFIAGKDATQEEFFHTFNTLHSAAKQIVISSDRPPKAIVTLEERLRSRFQWGLSCDLQPPGLETRMAILRRRAEEDGIDLSSEVIEFIARTVTSNIRELEGALIRLLAHAALEDRPVDRSMARQVLTDLREESSMVLDIPKIQEVVCGHFGISIERVRGRTRKREVVQARQVAMHFAKQHTQHSLKTIGLHFGGRDHSTVIHALRTVENNLETDPKYAQMVEEIQRKIDLRTR